MRSVTRVTLLAAVCLLPVLGLLWLGAPSHTVLETDHEFDGGSKVEISSLTPVQVENLVMLGKVWGFLKYHHPVVVRGDRHWDYELFRILPRVLASDSRPTANDALRRWIADLGPFPSCRPCAEAPEGRPLVPRLDWLSREDQLGGSLAALLRSVYANRPVVDRQFYVSFATAGNPDFGRESGSPAWGVPDAGQRLLALFRLWNIVEYWFPYRDVMNEDWDDVLREFIPRVVVATSREQYELAMMALVARVHDGHANVWNLVRPPRGACTIPVWLRSVEHRFVVGGYLHARLGPAAGLRIGDVVQSVGAETVERLVDAWRPHYGASNEAAYRQAVAEGLARGACGPVVLGVDRAGRALELTASRAPISELGLRTPPWHDVPGPTFRRLSNDLAYLKLSTMTQAEASEHVRSAAGVRCLVLDVRNYPEFVVFSLGPHLVAEKTDFAVFTTADPSNPGSFRWTVPVSLTPAPPRFPGRIAILVDEMSMSRAEYVALALRAVPGALVVGGTTAGADGNFSSIPLPGGLRAGISGIGVFYPDRRPTQRVGIVPDVVARPTIAGIRAGRDEVLEAAVEAVIGRAMTAAEAAALRSPPAP
jgi:hypothetical protein